MEQIEIYTDGSWDWKSRTGGWAARIQQGATTKVISGAAENTTNNRMELQAVIEALQSLKTKCTIELFTDSMYVIRILQAKRSVFNKNGDLCRLVKQLALEHEVSAHWVKGHSGNEFNELVDTIAREEMRCMLDQLSCSNMDSDLSLNLDYF